MRKIIEMRTNWAEVKHENRLEIIEGCTKENTNRDSSIIGEFDTLESALNALNQGSTSISIGFSTSRYYTVSEKYIQENTYDEKGNVVEFGEIIAYSKIKIDVMDVTSEEAHSIIGRFNNFTDAERFIENQDAKCILSF